MLLGGCANPYIAPNKSNNTSNLEIKLLTNSSAGGVGVYIGNKGNCLTDKFIGGMKKGHTFLSDKATIQTIIKSKSEVTLKINVADTILYTCETIIKFKPKSKESYLAEYKYHLPGCKIQLYKVTNGKKIIMRNDKVKICQ